MKKEFKEALENSPIITAIKDDEGLQKCKSSDSQVVFILYGDVLTIPDIVKTVKSSGKIAMVHIDLITGLSSKEITVDFLKRYTEAFLISFRSDPITPLWNNQTKTRPIPAGIGLFFYSMLSMETTNPLTISRDGTLRGDERFPTKRFKAVFMRFPLLCHDSTVLS